MPRPGAHRLRGRRSPGALQGSEVAGLEGSEVTGLEGSQVTGLEGSEVTEGVSEQWFKLALEGLSLKGHCVMF